MGQSMKKFAVVTGASSGIGFELAKQFAANGFDLLVVAEDHKINGCAATLRQLGGEVIACQLDLTKNPHRMDETSGVMQLWGEIEKTGRNIDAVALNAGVGVGGSFLDTGFHEELMMIKLNVISTWHLAKHVAKKMAAQGSGRILFTASVASVMPTPFEATYGATKAFVLGLSNALREEMKPYNVSVTALMPGPTETNFFHRADLDDTKVGQDEKDDPADVARDGFNALMNGEDKVVAHSMKSKMMGYMSYFSPDEITARMHAKLAEPGSAYKQ